MASVNFRVGAKTKRELRNLGRRWVRGVRNAVSGRILKIRTRRLFKSIRLRQNFRNPEELSIEVTAEAVDPRNDFDYASFHEFFSGRSYIGSELGEALRKNNTVKRVNDAFVEDFHRMLRTELLSMGWTPGRGPSEVVRRLVVK